MASMNLLRSVLLSFALSITALAAGTGLFDNAQGSRLVDLIDKAKTSLDIEIYEMDDPKVFASLRKALKRGVKLRVVKEPTPVGASCHVFEAIDNDDLQLDGDSGVSCADQKRFVSEVKKGGGKYVSFKKSELCGGNSVNCVQHGKLVIADAKVALISSGNFNTSSLCNLSASPSKCNRDYTYLTADSSVVQSLKNVVDKDIVGKSYDVANAISASAQAKLTVGPNSLEPLLAFIHSARKSIALQNQYLKDPSLNDALVAAAERGVEVKVTLASACSFGKPKPTEAKKLTTIFTEFDAAGIETRMFHKNIRVNGKPGYLHSKAIVVDGDRAWMGSVNGSTQATTRNREFGIFFDGSADVSKLVAIIDKDFAPSETWQESLDCAENQ